MKNLKKLAGFLLILFLTSCPSTVEDPGPENLGMESLSGVVSAQILDEDTIEIQFSQAPDSEEGFALLDQTGRAVRGLTPTLEGSTLTYELRTPIDFGKTYYISQGDAAALIGYSSEAEYRKFIYDVLNFVDIGGGFKAIVDWLTQNLSWFFDGISFVITGILESLVFLLQFPLPLIVMALFAGIMFWLSDWKMSLFTFFGFGLIWYMGLWSQTMDTMALVLTSVIIALIIGIPLGIWSSKSKVVWGFLRPALDFMQTLPAFVYLIPAVLFFSLGPVPGVVATLIFALPPAVRLTNLGIRQVPKEIKEAAISFGSTNMQMLLKAELPVALPTIMAGVNQTIMLALSMVVVAGLIGAGGLGNEVVRGITQMNVAVGFEGGLAIVILAIFLDRVTQALGEATQKQG